MLAFGSLYFVLYQSTWQVRSSLLNLVVNTPRGGLLCAKLQKRRVEHHNVHYLMQYIVRTR